MTFNNTEKLFLTLKILSCKSIENRMESRISNHKTNFIPN